MTETERPQRVTIVGGTMFIGVLLFVLTIHACNISGHLQAIRESVERGQTAGGPR